MSETDLRNYNRKFMEEFIEMYRSFPSLWKIKSKDYNNRTYRNKAYEKLIIKLREVEPDANRDMVIRKFNSLRGAFRRELKKVKKSKQPGCPKQIYVPHLWYFDKLLFLVNQEQDDKEDSSMDSCNDEAEMHFQDVKNIQVEEFAAVEEASIDEDSLLLPTQNLVQRKSCETLVENNSDDRCYLFGKNVELKLKSMSREQHILAEKIISDVLFYGELGHLTLDIARSIPNILSSSSVTSKHFQAL